MDEIKSGCDAYVELRDFLLAGPPLSEPEVFDLLRSSWLSPVACYSAVQTVLRDPRVSPVTTTKMHIVERRFGHTPERMLSAALATLEVARRYGDDLSGNADLLHSLMEELVCRDGHRASVLWASLFLFNNNLDPADGPAIAAVYTMDAYLSWWERPAEAMPFFLTWQHFDKQTGIDSRVDRAGPSE